MQGLGNAQAADPDVIHMEVARHLESPLREEIRITSALISTSSGAAGATTLIKGGHESSASNPNAGRFDLPPDPLPYVVGRKLDRPPRIIRGPALSVASSIPFAT